MNQNSKKLMIYIVFFSLLSAGAAFASTDKIKSVKTLQILSAKEAKNNDKGRDFKKEVASMSKAEKERIISIRQQSFKQADLQSKKQQEMMEAWKKGDKKKALLLEEEMIHLSDPNYGK